MFFASQVTIGARLESLLPDHLKIEGFVFRDLRLQALQRLVTEAFELTSFKGIGRADNGVDDALGLDDEVAAVGEGSRARYALMKNIRSPRNNPPLIVLRAGTLCTSDSLSGVSVTVSTPSLRSSMLTCNSTAAGLVLVNRPGNTFFRVDFTPKEVPSWRVMCVNRAKGLGVRKPQDFGRQPRHQVLTENAHEARKGGLR